jgi:hypothetical protein
MQKGVSWKEERNDNRGNEMKYESGRRLGEGKENTRVRIHRQDTDFDWLTS